MSREQRARITAGLLLFISLSFLGSWFIAATLRVFGLTVAPISVGTRLFTTSLFYALTMGWQPVVATWVVRRWIDPPDHLDLGLRPSSRMFSLVGGVGALLFAVAATLVALVAIHLGLTDPTAINGTAEIYLPASSPSMLKLLGLGAVLIATITLVWIQAFAEEIGWRGYFLPRAMERFGRWQGLVLHGAIWGLWYAPVLFFASYGQLDPFGSFSRSFGFVITCMLLGTLFGWLRLAAKSLAPVVLANTTLTLAAGLPYVVHGIDAGLRSAAFGPPGWLVLLLIIAGLLLSEWKAVVQTPAHLLAFPDMAPAMFVRVWIVLEGHRTAKNKHLPN